MSLDVSLDKHRWQCKTMVYISLIGEFRDRILNMFQEKCARSLSRDILDRYMKEEPHTNHVELSMDVVILSSEEITDMLRNVYNQGVLDGIDGRMT